MQQYGLRSISFENIQKLNHKATSITYMFKLRRVRAFNVHQRRIDLDKALVCQMVHLHTLSLLFNEQSNDNLHQADTVRRQVVQGSDDKRRASQNSR